MIAILSGQIPYLPNSSTLTLLCFLRQNQLFPSCCRNGSCAVKTLQVLGERGLGVRGYAAETGREGTSGDELSGDPNRAPEKKGEGVRQEKEGDDDIKKV